MPPNTDREAPTTGALYETDEVTFQNLPTKSIKPVDRELEIVWRNVVLYIYLVSASLYGAWLYFTAAKWSTVIFGFILYELGGLGITAGVHRLWAHRAYKATTPLRIFLMLCNTLAFQDPVIHWARDHRVHHKFSETDADPHNANRGFFFCHVGWLLCKKHPLVKEKGRQIDVSDLWADPVIVFQKNYYNYLMPLVSFILPVAIPMYFWGESFTNAYHVNFFRYFVNLNATWFVNSAAHMWGTKPYDKFISPVENVFVTILALGEGWHNYHHTFPWDYKAAELSYYLNISTVFIDLCGKLGLAYDMRTITNDVVKKRAIRTGDGSHGIWGWGDKDQKPKEKEIVVTLNKKDE